MPPISQQPKPIADTSRPVFRDLRWGVYVVVKAPNAYARNCFREYGLKTDATGWYAAMYKPFHLIGLELGISVLSAALRGEPTGAPRGFRGDVVAVAKRNLRAGENLDGEGGYTVWGKLVPAETSLAQGALPIGLAHRVALVRDLAAGAMLRWALCNPAISTALVGFRTPAEVTENLGALGWAISSTDMAEVDAILARQGCVSEPPGWLED